MGELVRKQTGALELSPGSGVGRRVVRAAAEAAFQAELAWRSLEVDLAITERVAEAEIKQFRRDFRGGRLL